MFLENNFGYYIILSLYLCYKIKNIVYSPVVIGWLVVSTATLDVAPEVASVSTVVGLADVSPTDRK